eukprot:206834-Chlamydomonas_euryale.AAC.1
MSRPTRAAPAPHAASAAAGCSAPTTQRTGAPRSAGPPPTRAHRSAAAALTRCAARAPSPDVARAAARPAVAPSAPLRRRERAARRTPHRPARAAPTWRRRSLSVSTSRRSSSPAARNCKKPCRGGQGAGGAQRETRGKAGGAGDPKQLTLPTPITLISPIHPLPYSRSCPS